MLAKNVPILLVDDDQVDQELMRRKFRVANIDNSLFIANDGVEALNMLRNPESPLSQPCIILMDINLPRMNGFETLRMMREDPAMKRNIVFMLSTSSRQMDVLLAYDLNVAGYFYKKEMDSLVTILRIYCNSNEFGRA